MEKDLSLNFVLEKKYIPLEDIISLVSKNVKIELSPSLEKDLQDSFLFLKQYSKDRVVYGVNTGFGPMAQYKIDLEKQLELQYNLIRSHSSGMGIAIGPQDCKAILLDRIITFSKCKSGIHIDLMKLQIALFNQEIYPVVYEHGGVGASGDLVQLAHVALVMIGEGKCWYKNEIVETKALFQKLGIKPFEIQLREGLALINGTSGMTGLSLLNIIQANRLILLSIRAGGFLNELMGSLNEYFSDELNSAKHHLGQNKVATLIQQFTSDSKLMKSHHDEIIDIHSSENKYNEKVQGYYSLRCLPQIIGPILDTLDFANKIIEQEFNSVSDNPIIDAEKKRVYHGGNFHGDYISLENDKLKIAITKLSLLLDRQLNYLLNDHLNEKLPPFLNKGILGLNFGMQGVQYPSTSTVAENQMLSNPLSIHSISSNKDNQDVVSMGFNSSNVCKRVINNTYQVLSIQLVALCEATEILDVRDKLSTSSSNLYRYVREHVPPIESDFSISVSLSLLHQSLTKLNDQ